MMRLLPRRRRWLLGLAALAVALLGVWLFAPRPPHDAGAGSFAGLGEAAGAYPQARAGRPLRFPEDHGPHPAYRLEWWYLTANLEDPEGRPLGLQWTLFRQALAPPGEGNSGGNNEDDAASPWASHQLWMAHAALSRGATHRVAERFARGGIQQAGVEAAPFRAWLDDWRLVGQAEDPAADPLSRLEVRAFDAGQGENGEGAFGYRLRLTAEGPLVAHGEAGFSQKSADGQGSYYYSQPFYRVEGEVRLDGERIPVRGRAWLDREWSSQLLGPEQHGWDWFSLHLNDGAKLMAFRLRGGGESDGGDYLAGSWIGPKGELTPLKQDALTLTPLTTQGVAGRDLPTRWRLALPDRGLALIVTARHPDRWMATRFPYWEGAVTVEDAASGVPFGEGYLEMTGY